MKLYVIKIYRGTYTNEELARISEWEEVRRDNPRIEVNHPSGVVDLVVKNPDEIATLALISYEPVLWRISPENNISIIYLSGYNPSDVCGENENCKVLRREYEGRDKDDLIKEIESDTSTKLCTFQDAYNGKKFFIV